MPNMLYEQETVVLSDPEYPKIKASINPWVSVPKVTPEMQLAARNLIRDNAETSKLIEDIEGPTEEETSAWTEEVAEIMQGLGNS